MVASRPVRTRSAWARDYGQGLTQPGGVARREGVLIVVEVAVGVDAPTGPLGQPLGDGPEPAAGVTALVGELRRPRPVEAQVGPVRGELPRVVGEKVVDAERGPVAAERLEDVVM